MERFIINGGKKLYGEVDISGAKNAVVALLPATLLARDKVTLGNVPSIRDVHIMLDIMEQLGATVEQLDPNTYTVDTKNVAYQVVPQELTSKLRASYYLLGAMLGTFGKAEVGLPGGCDFGGRPIDYHLKGFRCLGASVDSDDSVVKVYSEQGMHGASIYMDRASVGATINVMLAAVTTPGITIIENAAKEPHIVDLAILLNLMGANVRGAGQGVIKIKGVESLHGCQYSAIPDQIEAGTYMAAVAATGGELKLNNVTPKHLESIVNKLLECGVDVEEGEDYLRIKREDTLSSCQIRTLPHPGFPTDMQPQFAAMLCVANGESEVKERVWDNRFQYVQQLQKFGADIRITPDGRTAYVEGPAALHGACVKATDLRAGAAMIIAALAAQGESVIEGIDYIERGYENVVEKFRALGADIRREAN